MDNSSAELVASRIRGEQHAMQRQRQETPEALTSADIARAYAYFPNREITTELVDKFIAVYAKLKTDYPDMSEQDRRYNLALRMQAYDSNREQP